MASDLVLEINEDNFEALVMDEEKPVLLDFWASWCGPCRMVAPHVDAVAEDMEGELVVGKVNVDEQAELAARFGVMSIPTLILMKDGHVVETMIGARSRNDILKTIRNKLE
jgi:thioredoxin 1